VQVEPVLATLSLKYTSEHLCFGVLNVAAAPALAKHLRISLDPLTSRQLPTLIMFDKGAEVGRIPQVRRRGCLLLAVCSVLMLTNSETVVTPLLFYSVRASESRLQHLNERQ
jgi:hypothetical protein